MEMTNAAVKPQNQNSVVRPFLMSHGTMECYNLKETRTFYEEFLGLECVRHAKPAMVVRCGLKFFITCVEVSNDLHPCGWLNHWGLDVESKAEVDRVHAEAIRLKEKYKIRRITKPTEQHGVYSFYLEDLNHNWWEVQYYDGFQHDDHWDFGDRFSMDEDAHVPGMSASEVPAEK